jgi:3-hydroxybutyryl-CoA dehydrogenase
MGTQMTRITVVGAGTMGAGLGRLFTAGGHNVRLHDERPDVATRTANRIEGVRAVEGLQEAVVDAEVCVEAIVEEIGAKQRLMAAIAAAAPPDAILATNTSALSIAAIGADLHPSDRRRLAGAHFFNPPDVVPAVEVVRGPDTAPEVVQSLLELLRSVGKVCAIVTDTPGFVANRIQHAMVVEAWRCFEEGVATAEDIDAIVSASFGFRLFAFGPFQLGDFNGLDVYESVMKTLEEAYGERFRPPRALVERVARGAFGVKSGEGVFRYEDGEGDRALERRDTILARLSALRVKELG